MSLLNTAGDFFVSASQKTTTFLKNNFEISYNKKTKIIGMVIAFLTLLGVVFRAENFISQEFSAKWVLLFFALACPFILYFTAAYTVKIKKDISLEIFLLIWFPNMRTGLHLFYWQSLVAI